MPIALTRDFPNDDMNNAKQYKMQIFILFTNEYFTLNLYNTFPLLRFLVFF